MHLFPYVRDSSANRIMGKNIFIPFKFYNNQMNNIKIVDKFQFIQEESISDGEVTIIPAWHSVLNRAYTLKQINIGQNSKGRYAALLREVNILKSISGEWAIKCHKMLRTTHNVYIAYDRFGDNTLQHYLKAGGRLKGIIQKEELALKLIGLVVYLKQSNIVNLNVLPRNIQIIEKQLKETVDIVLRINNFQYAAHLDEGQDRSLLETLQLNQYHPPQLLVNPPIIGQHCHIFTIGKILQKLFFSQNQSDSSRKDPFQIQKIHKIQQIINKMTLLDHRNRITSDQLTLFHSNFVNKHHSRIKRSKTMLNMRQIGSMQTSNRLQSKGSLHLSPRQEDEFQTKQQKSIFIKIGLKIAKRRNLAIFLIACSKIISSLEYIQLQQSLKLSFLLLKKSTRVITQLFKYIMTGYQIGFKISQKDWRRYSKQQQYNKLRSIIQTQMNLSKLKLNMYLQKLLNSCIELLDDPIFKRQTQQQKINDEYLTNSIISTIKILIQNKCIKIESKENVKYLLMMSYVKEFTNFENMFQELINQEINLLTHQTLFIKIEELSLQQLINRLQITIQQMK